MKLIPLLAFALAVVEPAVSQNLRSHDVTELGAYELAYPYPSPDGRSVVFIEWLPNASGDTNGDIVVLELDTGARRNLTHSPEFDGHPHWGTSGKWIYFSSDQPSADGGSAFVQTRINVETGERQKLAGADHLPGSRGIPDANEETIYFNRPGGGGRTLLYSARLPASN